MELVDVPVGSEAKLEVDLVEGKLQLSFAYEGKGVGSKLSVMLEPEYFMDKLAAAIPGKIDDAVLALIKGALK